MAGWRVTLDGAGSSAEAIRAIEARDGSSGRPSGYWVRGARAEWGGGREERQEGKLGHKGRGRKTNGGRERARASRRGRGGRPGEGVRALAGWGEEV